MAMFDSALTSVITVDDRADTIGFYIMNGTDRNSIQFNMAKCAVKNFNDEFFVKFGKVIKLFRDKFPQIPLQKTALVLPDHLFLMDTVKVPVIHRKAVNHALDLAVETLYKNRKELEINTEILQQNRKQITYALSGVRKDLLERLKATCEENKVGVQGATFAANATVNGAAALNPRLKGGTYLLLDIRESNACFAFVVKGKTVGYYSLPFGYSILTKNRVAAEDMLFDHTSGELLVLNAKERARAKQLTMADEGETSPEVEADEDGEGMESAEGVNYESRLGGVMKKSARKLPKFMLRPTPQSREEYAYENFRLFVKWTLELIASNGDITEAGMPEAVYVNLPEEFDFLYDMVNDEQEENKIPFAPLLTGGEAGEKIARHLDLFGGFYIGQYNKNCTF